MLLAIYMLFVLMDYQGGIDGFISTTFVQPVIGSIISILTILFCLFIGLPIRLAKNLNAWWSEKYFLPVSGVLVGIVLLATSFLPAFNHLVQVETDGEFVAREVPNTWIIVSGWFITTFFLLHIFPPQKLRVWLKMQLNKLKLS